MFVCTLCSCLSSFPQKLMQTTAKSPCAWHVTSLVELLLRESRLCYITDKRGNRKQEDRQHGHSSTGDS